MIPFLGDSMWIENTSLHGIMNGYHYDPGPNCMLIRIVDPDMKFPPPLYKFTEVYNFKFLDIEEDDSPYSISEEQAEVIVAALDKAIKNHMNVIVHCVAGICRSGAVVEAGIALGFQDTEVHRIPNVLVKKKLFDAIGKLKNSTLSPD